MAGRVAGKVAIITGAARGQGRSHAVRLAEEGDDIIAIHSVEAVTRAPYPMASREDMDEAVRLAEDLDRRTVASRGDVRDYDGIKKAVDDCGAQRGRLDILSANAGISGPMAPTVDHS